MLPAGLTEFERVHESQDKRDAQMGDGACVLLTVPNLQLHLRTHDYFMGLSFLLNSPDRSKMDTRLLEMSLNADPMSGTVEEEFRNEAMFINPPSRHSKELFSIDGKLHFDEYCLLLT
jgi:hypothetical protein